MKQIVYILLFIPIFLNAQNGWKKVEVSTYFELLRNFEKSIPENEDYSLTMDYAIFNDFADQKPIKTFKGKVVCRDGNQLNVSQMGLFVIQNEKLNLTIDSTNRQILIQHSDSSFFYRKTLSDFKIASEIIQNVQIKENNNKTILNVELKEGAPYKAMVITFLDKKTISKIEIYGNRPYYSENNSNSQKKSKLVVDFGHLRIGANAVIKKFRNINEFIEVVGDTIRTTKDYKGFKIIDLRN